MSQHSDHRVCSFLVSEFPLRKFSELCVADDSRQFQAMTPMYACDGPAHLVCRSTNLYITYIAINDGYVCYKEVSWPADKMCCNN